MTGTAADAIAPEAPAPLSHRQVLLIFSGLMLGMFLAALDQTIVATALPTIVGEFGGLENLSWVITAYLLASTVSTPLYGKLGDLFGRKHVFQAAIGIFLVGSVLSGISQSMLQLVGFRALQGLGAGGLIVLAQATIGDVVSPRQRGRYQGYFGAVFGASSVIGPFLGGFFTDALSWRWVFYINIPLGAIALVVTALVLPPSVRRGHPKIDYRGAALLAGGVGALVLVTTWGGGEYPWGSRMIIGLALTSAVLLVGFVLVERTAAEPVLPLRLFANKVFRVSSAVSFILGTAMFGAISFLPLFLQVASGASATSSGLGLVPLMAGFLSSSVLCGRAISHTGRYRRFPIAGTGIAALGFVLLSTMTPDTPRLLSGAFMVVVGAGMGLVMQVLVLAAQNAVGASDLGVATSVVTFFRSVGGSVGVAVFGAMFNSRLTSGLGPIATGEGEQGLTVRAIRALPPGARAEYVEGFADALTGVFLYAVPALVLAFVLACFLKDIPLRGSTRQHSAPAAPAANAA